MNKKRRRFRGAVNVGAASIAKPEGRNAKGRGGDRSSVAIPIGKEWREVFLIGKERRVATREREKEFDDISLISDRVSSGFATRKSPIVIELDYLREEFKFAQNWRINTEFLKFLVERAENIILIN